MMLILIGMLIVMVKMMMLMVAQMLMQIMVLMLTMMLTFIGDIHDDAFLPLDPQRGSELIGLRAGSAVRR